MTNKEQIIINGKKQYCKILFRCKHIDDTAAYDMMCEGIEIKPENAPVSDFELMLIENTNSPFGFSLVCKRNNKEDVWEHSGFGNSGACSIVTALLKQLARKTQGCEALKEELKDMTVRKIEYLDESLKYQKECEELKELLKLRADDRINKLERAIIRRNVKIECYRKALEEIEEYCNSVSAEENLYNSHHFSDGSMVVEVANGVLDIINKAKGLQ